MASSSRRSGTRSPAPAAQYSGFPSDRLPEAHRYRLRQRDAGPRRAGDGRLDGRGRERRERLLPRAADQRPEQRRDADDAHRQADVPEQRRRWLPGPRSAVTRATSNTRSRSRPANWHDWVVINVSANPAFAGTDSVFKAFPPQDQNLDQIRGPLIIEGGIGLGRRDRSLHAPVLLPNETDLLERPGTATRRASPAASTR